MKRHSFNVLSSILLELCPPFYSLLLHWYLTVRWGFRLISPVLHLLGFGISILNFIKWMCLLFLPMCCNNLQKTCICFLKFLTKVLFKEWNANKMSQQTQLAGATQGRPWARGEERRQHPRFNAGQVQCVRFEGGSPYGRVSRPRSARSYPRLMPSICGLLVDGVALRLVSSAYHVVRQTSSLFWATTPDLYSKNKN